ncbi:serine hydrolase domain-containing protein [Dermatobacter hominis]|uniref:serine hydrolase domain-containing protein n=1 Tax=Dermatobacter hominis TaxID=2884263 RepID=UPI001D1244DA|nr:beta-lactamase family protein [Dermatobacter hominis]UDY34325.1 beta-lactamase family protein [Dermatobacter hominis]
MTEVHGHCDERFNAVRDAFQANFDNGLEDGASVAIAVEGELVVDLWGGVADRATGAPWEEDTLCCLWSSTKTMAALCLLTLADRGLVDLDAPVATYWPEFAANGKDGVLVRHVMSHTAGLPGWGRPISLDDLYDVRSAAALLADDAPWWEPGTAAGYHAVTQGFLLGELVRRVTGDSLGTFFRTNLAEPLGADFHIGTGPEHDHRIATIIPPTKALGGRSSAGSVGERALNNPVITADVGNTVDYRRIELPASNGHGNARSMAQVQSIVSGGGSVGGRSFLSEDAVAQIFREQWVGPDLVQEIDTRLGIGFGLNGPEVPVSANPRACFWGGWGGSVVINDLDARTTFAYGMNRMGDGLDTDFRAISLVFAWQASAMAA